MKKYLINAGVALLLGALAGACTPSYADTGIDVRNADGTITPLAGTDGQPSLAKLAHERNVGSLTGTDYGSEAGEWKATLVNTNATGDVTIYNGPAIVRIIRVRATTNAGVATANTAGIILVKDGTTVKDGAAAGKTPSSTIYDGLDGAMFRTRVVINFAAAGDNPASDGKVEVLYRPLDQTNVW